MPWASAPMGPWPPRSVLHVSALLYRLRGRGCERGSVSHVLAGVGGLQRQAHDLGHEEQDAREDAGGAGGRRVARLALER